MRGSQVDDEKKWGHWDAEKERLGLMENEKK